MERALLATISFKAERDRGRIEDRAVELEELVSACGVEIVDNIVCNCEKPTPDLLIGSGKARELADIALEKFADSVIFSRDLSGTQQRNLEEVIGKKTIDRTQLILDIFARRARSPEGTMQVELAQLQYLMPRLIGKGIILSRLGGGVGTRGPGEQKLEVDRRRIRQRIDRLREDLGRLSARRATMRKQRVENNIPALALVGYTNAGKSTLLNALCAAQTIVRDGLFTTLDPLSRKLRLPNGENVVLSDTVGFLNDLPHHLIEAFKATLEEVSESDVLIHVLDASDPQAHEHTAAVFDVLRQLGADQKPIITALNKIDRIENQAHLQRLCSSVINPVAVSAARQLNLDGLLKRIEEEFADRMSSAVLNIPLSRMDLVDKVYREAKVSKSVYLEKGVRLSVSVPKVILQKLLTNKEIKQEK